jgi:hypothetical protein
MNRARILLLAEEIEHPTLGLRFNMHYFANVAPEVTAAMVREHPCGTVCCIGGTAVVMFGDDAASPASPGWAARVLDLTVEQQQRVFHNRGGWLSSPKRFLYDQYDVTRAEAARGLRRLVAEDIADERARIKAIDRHARRARRRTRAKVDEPQMQLT